MKHISQTEIVFKWFHTIPSCSKHFSQYFQYMKFAKKNASDFEEKTLEIVILRFECFSVDLSMVVLASRRENPCKSWYFHANQIQRSLAESALCSCIQYINNCKCIRTRLQFKTRNESFWTAILGWYCTQQQTL